jgi:hypothetical protein
MTFSGEIHPYAAAFPLLPADELRALADDIKRNGLRRAITLDAKGVLLDGRNRLEACTIASIEPRFDEHDGDAVAFIMSANLYRRNITTGQRAAGVALGLLDQDKRHDGRWDRDSVPVMQDSALRGWAQQMRQAGVVADVDVTQLQAVLLGSIALDTAYKEADAKRKQRARDAEHTTTLRDAAPDIAELITDAKLTLDEAWSAYEKRTEEQRRVDEQQAAARQDRNLALAESLHRISREDPSTFVEHAWPAHRDDVSSGVRITVKRIEKAIDVLTQLREALT